MIPDDYISDPWIPFATTLACLGTTVFAWSMFCCPMPSQFFPPQPTDRSFADGQTLCLALDYRPAARYLPKSVKLTSSRLEFGAWSKALFGPDHWMDRGEWRFATPDSIDVAWHHSPMMRLPFSTRHGEALVGRGGTKWFETLFTAVMFGDEYRFTVIAVPTPCKESAGRE